jgi:phosphoribosyl-ATP pyrophosphohydrolase/phosphoribosyl-AMP cyclohydrolase
VTEPPERAGGTPIDWSAGPVPCVVQDARTGELLMLAWMNQQAFQRTRETGEAHFWSRSRQTLWRKGETSGHTLRVVGARVDCDGDAVLLEAVPNGPACHTGQPTCFYRSADGAGAAQGPVLARLEAVIADRAHRRPDRSYTAALLSGGVGAIAAKIVEEAEEVVQAARHESDRRLAEEAADLLYHLIVLLGARGVGLADALDVLLARER